MTLQATLLVLLSALAHSLWNLNSKKTQPSLSYFWLASFWAGLCCLPMIVWQWPLLAVLTVEFWWLMLATGFFQVIYILGLVMAYQRGQMSVLYPMIRSLPLVLLLLWGWLWGQHLSLWASLGMLLICLASLLLPMLRFNDLKRSHYFNSASLFVLMAALGTAGYSWIDDLGSQALGQQALQLGGQHPGLLAILYVVLQNYAATLLMLVPLAWQKWQRPQQRLLWSRQWAQRSAAVTGLLMMLTYALVVWAMAYSDHVGLVVALRQVSIVFSLGLGIWLLGEQAAWPKLVGTLLMLVGLAFIILLA